MDYKKILRFFFGTTLLIFLFSLLDLQLLSDTLKSVDERVYVVSIVLCLMGNLFCAIRWISLCQSFKFNIPKKTFVFIYFESIAANCILPGGILGGDVWRTSRIISESKKHGKNSDSFGKISKKNQIALISLSVFADRAHGFWLLCFIGICSFSVLLIDKHNKYLKNIFVDPSNINQLFFYAIGLLLILIFPVLIYFLYTKLKRGNIKNKFFHLNNYIIANYIFELIPLSINKKLLFFSLLSQLFFGFAFWVCLHSVGIEINILYILFVVPGIFLFGILPISIGGFGPREAGALIFIALYGVNNEHIFASSILFGLTSTIIGLLTILLSVVFQIRK
ncbi:MAG: hypothetical protein CBD16_05470 [Betaproteobacteria bacterium TMED156]|nr:MAG: hypothetical protein CBD16_05470 [Betaproteobacteria bacterium TMED156]